ncbi:Rieske (2Fe-2S) protein [Variovorax ginsengisoli]|jgi:nitrite reductase/ring-hydroxylating ferredoxin subunit|uniref:Rieske 2Fe-2S domain-containing protein n=1 Tax=Variovorax ginsengisoli TaxID=363844 RepID=A0ABT8SGR7_9BURK|nr:Rieske 2Fe-2S domain-containing protein [Variovorax ginsengisoli]MDN8618825.1 Rieske 2Fe-2S domain-containing protein [Variovorax ginsengisoli]MDO1537995.1 Rieske 2Fe-2S domain-containing protein [Variovorax ginsengisoli]
MPARPLCHVDELNEGSARGFALDRPGRDSMFLVKHEGMVHGYRNDCPHWPGSPMVWRRDGYLNRDATRIVCSGHAAEFEIASGRCTLGPCLGRSLTPVRLEIDAQGWVLAVIDAVETTHGD